MAAFFPICALSSAVYFWYKPRFGVAEGLSGVAARTSFVLWMLTASPWTTGHLDVEAPTVSSFEGVQERHLITALSLACTLQTNLWHCANERPALDCAHAQMDSHAHCFFLPRTCTNTSRDKIFVVYAWPAKTAKIFNLENFRLYGTTSVHSPELFMLT